MQELDILAADTPTSGVTSFPIRLWLTAPELGHNQKPKTKNQKLNTKNFGANFFFFDGRGPRFSTPTRLQLVGPLPLAAPPAAICLCTVL